jgi:hypothetical protein
MDDQDPKGSFVRWQTVTVAQLTYAINLLLTFAVATLGYQVALLGEDKFSLAASWQKCLFSASLLFLSASILFGLAVVVNRLRSFRATMRAARAREKGNAEALATNRALYKMLDPRTWWLFWWQVGTFAAGMVLTVESVLSRFGERLV